MTGQSISHYRILEKLGEGAMGVVYRAEDTKLRRPVALKFLSAAEGDDALRDRFLREAQAAAALNHPNICTIFEIDEERGFLAMELVEGPSLKDRIAERPLKLDEALDFASQIAAGLQAAHGKGVTHRDIKPANILLTGQGQVKITDFGLAALADRTRLTKTGTSMGTPAFMSPEQAQGQPTDRRTDLWSLGVVLYEMIAGRVPFRGETDAALARAVIDDDPEPLTAQRIGLPVELDRVVSKALAKEPGERYQHVEDLLVDLRSIPRSTSGKSLAITKKRQRPWIWAAAGALAACLPWTLAMWRLSEQSETLPAAVRLNIPINTKEPMFVTQYQMALSPDGSRLVYAAGSLNLSHLYTRSLDSFETHPIRGVETTSNPSPFFSPDGKWLGYFAGGLAVDLQTKLLKVPIDGGNPETICRLPLAPLTNFAGADWERGGNIFFGSKNGGLMQVPARGGTPQAATVLDEKKGELSHRWPQVLPGGKAVLFTVEGPGTGNFRIAVEMLATHERREVTPKGAGGRYVASGHLVYGWNNSLLARAFDPERLEATGPEVTILENLRPDGLGSSQFALSKNGTLVYAVGGTSDERVLVWVDRQGVEKPLPAPRQRYSTPRFSPDGRRLTLDIPAGPQSNVWTRSNVWTYDLERDVLARVSSDGRSSSAIWTPDGKNLIISRSEDSVTNLVSLAADGSGQARKLFPSENAQWAGSWSPDGRLLAFMEFNPKTLGDILVLSPDGEPRSRPVVRAPSTQWGGRISPDGRWLAYVSDETGRFEVYVTSFPSGDGKWQISTEGGTEVVWARNGRELFWRNGKRMMVAGIEAQTGFAATKPRPLFSGYLTGLPGLPEYDVSPDGQRFLMISGAEMEASPAQLNVVLNWFEELKSRVRPGK